MHGFVEHKMCTRVLSNTAEFVVEIVSVHCPSEMMYGCVVLVLNVLATLTTAKDGLVTSVGELEAIKDSSGVAQCVTSPPNKTVTARSKIDCMRVCISDACSCAYGANYHSDDKRCELHNERPDSLEQVPNCIYYQVLFLDFVHISREHRKMYS